MGIGLIVAGVILILGIILSIVWDDGIVMVPTIITAFFLFTVVSLSSSAIYARSVGTEMREISSTEIYSIGLRDNIEGHFTLGCGGISTNSVYAYYTKDKDGCFILKKTYCNETKVKETNEISPCIKTYGERFKSGKRSWLWAFGDDIYVEPDYYIIYIPEGSIVQTYNITP